MKKDQMIFQENLLNTLREETHVLHSALILPTIMHHNFGTAWTKILKALAQFLTTQESTMNIKGGGALKAVKF